MFFWFLSNISLHNIILVLDYSQSMANNGGYKALVPAATQFINKVLENPNNKVAIITKSIDEAKVIHKNIYNYIENIDIVDIDTENFNKNLLIIPAYASKGLEFDSVIIINNFTDDKYLYYVAVTRAQHELVIFNSTN